MSRRNIATITCLAAALSFVLVVGCKKKQADNAGQGGMTPSADQGMKTPPVADMDPMDPAAMQPGMNTKPAAVNTGKGRVGAMPIPHDFLIISVYLKAARGSALFKKHEPKIKSMLAGAMAERKILADMLKKCKVDLLTGVDGVTVSHSTSSEDPEAGVVIAWGGFDTAKLMACIKPELKTVKIVFKDVTIGGKKGIEATLKGKTVTVLALGPASLAMIGKPVVAKAQAVLEGKLLSIEDTPNYKKGAELIKAKPATILSLLVPKIPPKYLAKIQFPIAKKVRALVAMVGVPAGGLEVHAGADFGEEKTAKSLARTLPALLGMVKAKFGAMGAKLLKNLKIKADGSWVRLAITVDKETFGTLQAMVMKKFGAMFTAKKMAPAPKPTVGKPTTKKGK
jgi:hypothetical protein